MEQKYVPSRPTTPLRPSSRASLRSNTSFNPYASTGGEGGSSHYNDTAGISSGRGGDNPLAALEPAFAELADGFADLEANMMHLQLLHESVGRFSENFAAFLYGMNVNAFCVDFPEAPVAESFRRMRRRDDEEERDEGASDRNGGVDPEVTIISTATSFIDHPASASAPVGGGRTTTATTTRGGATRGGATRGGRAAAAGGGGGSTRARGGAAGGTTSTRGSARGGGGVGQTAAMRGRASGIARGSTRAAR